MRSNANERSRRRLVEGRLPVEVLRFGLPLAVGMALHTAFNVLDLFMISRLEEGPAALAALGVCDMLAAIATILSTGISTAAVSLIARHLGADDLTRVRRVTWQSMWVVGALSLFFGVIGLAFADPIVRDLMGTKGAAADYAVPYLRIMLGGSFSIFLLLQVTAILRALGHAKSAALLLVGGNLLNIVLNAVLIYGPTPGPEVFAWGAPIAAALGVPRMGVEGAAWATLIARCVPLLLGMVLLLRRRGGPRFHRVYLRPMPKVLRAIWALGWPASAQLVLRVGAILFVVALINLSYTTAADQTAMTAFSVVLRLETMVLFVGMGWGAAASSFVGTNLGAGQLSRARWAGWITAIYNFAGMVLLVFVYLEFGEPVLAFFDPDPAVVAIGMEYLRVVAPTYAIFGVGVVLSQAMAGAGATFESLVVDAIVLLGAVLPAAWFFTRVQGLPRDGLWTVVAWGNVASAAAYLVYYVRGRFFTRAAP